MVMHDFFLQLIQWIQIDGSIKKSKHSFLPITAYFMTKIGEKRLRVNYLSVCQVCKSYPVKKSCPRLHSFRNLILYWVICVFIFFNGLFCKTMEQGNITGFNVLLFSRPTHSVRCLMDSMLALETVEELLCT